MSIQKQLDQKQQESRSRQLQLKKGQSFLAIDVVQAGVGDTVLALEEGNSARQVLKEPESFTVKQVIVAIVDNISVNW